MSEHILVIDDERDIRQLISLILETEGYTVTQCGGGSEGLQLLEQEPFDLVVLDIMMPEMDGWSVCRQIRLNPSTRDIPVLILTVRNQPLDRVIGLEVVRADGYLIKPFEREELITTVAQLVALRHSSVKPA